MHCLFCEKKISRLRNILREDQHFCSTAHRTAYAKQQSELGLAMLRQSQMQRVEKDPPREIVSQPASKCGFAQYAVTPKPHMPGCRTYNAGPSVLSSHVIRIRRFTTIARRLVARSAPAIDSFKALP